MKKRILSIFLALCMVMTILPTIAFTTIAVGEDFTATPASNGENYITLSWSGTTGSKYAITKSNGESDIYETIPLKYSIKVLNVYPDIGNNLKNWMSTNNMGSPTINGTKYSMTVDDVSITSFNNNPSAYLGTAGSWKYDVVYFGGYDANNNFDITLTARNILEQFIKSGGGLLLGHDTAAFNYSNFKYLASTYLNLQATQPEMYVPVTSPDYIPAYGNTKVKVARKGLLTNYPYTLGDVGAVLTVPESHSYHQFASGNIWFTYDGTNSNWDPSKPEMTTYKTKTGTNNFYLTTLNNVAMIQTGHSSGTATIDEQKILANTLYYLAQTTSQTTFDDHSAQDLTAPSKVGGSVTVSENSISFTASEDKGNTYNYKLYTVDDISGVQNDTGKRATATVTTGLKGYSYVIDQNPNISGIDTTEDNTSSTIAIGSKAPGNYYLHIRAVDNAGNASEESVLPFTVKSTQPVGKVSLNKPLFNNNKSGYSFKSATINNFTSVNSITFSITKGTTVQSVPSFLTPSSKLESIDGDTRTFTYVYEKGVTVSQAEEFIRGIVFNYVAGAEVSITVDNNTTKLPDGAKITKFSHTDGTDHYYMYVPSNLISWTNAYNMAKSYTYMGLKGYLATITSKEEDDILTNISTISAWSAGTRYLNAGNSKLADPASVSALSATANYYYWACGPEAGTIYYNSASPTLTPGAGYTGYNGAYNNWGANPQQPDANTTTETCMQVNWPYDTGATGQMRWNDLPNSGLPDVNLVKGYFVEFSSYDGGVESTYASDKTAVGTYNLTTDGGVEEVATVTLNAPVYGIGNKSEFSFANADLKNISMIYSLTIKLDNYTNVLSKPSTPAVSNELSNIAGATNTITYQFESGIALADAQSFLRGLKFRYGGLKTSSTTNVSVTVDGNKTNLPTGASITEFNGHYYIYVNDCLSWTDAYNKAKTYSYMGMKGYLATITSADEDKVLDNISMNGAWAAGTRYTGIYDLATAPNGTSVNNAYFIWACGPEAGTKYYYNNASPVNGAYNGFTDTNEPNGFIDRENSECCMQVHYKGNSSSPITWNDLCDRIYSGGTEPKVGYFVEFSDYDGGRVDGFTQSANGKSIVPISVEKGDVFNTVKNGGTYYVDTVLTAFDRNITKITVNGNVFTSGNKLTGNTNTTYTIVATDLESNTATMTITMKTIASISGPISGLTVSNVQMTDKDKILNVKTALMAIDTTDASSSQKTEIANAIQNCKNLYFALFNATATTSNGANGWYKNGIGSITLTAPDGFEISNSSTGTWANSITVDIADGANKITSYYLKETSTGDISSAKTFTYNVDTVAPTGTITIKNNTFKNFISTISFGLFFKNSVDVLISGEDTLSTPVSISYQKVKNGETYNENGTWTTGSSFSVPANEKFSVYAKITDNAGNVSIINTKGIIVYTDSTQGTSDIIFIKTSTTDVSATVNLNGNTINEIKNGTTVINNPTNYTVASNGTITFKASYLDSLAEGKYTLTVSYNPMGVSYTDETGNEAPDTTSITLTIQKADGAVTDINNISKIYDSYAVSKPNYKSLSTGSEKVEYKVIGAADSTYTTESPKNAGGYTVRITVAADKNYKEANAQANFSIAQKMVTITGTTVEAAKTYDGTTAATIKNIGTVSGNLDGANLTVKVGTAAYDTKNVAENKTVTFSNFELDGSAKNNYKLSTQPAATTANITTKELTVDVSVKDKQYNGKDNAEFDGTPSLVGVISGDKVVLANGIPAFASTLVADGISINFTSFSISGTDATNYKLTQPTGITASIKNYVATKDAEYSVNSGDWLKVDFVVTAKDGFKVSKTNTSDGAWSDTLSASDDTINGKLEFYVKNTATGVISDKVIENYKIDKTAPTGTISIGDNVWNEFLNTISFGLFFKSTQTVSITTNNDLSGIAKVEYASSSLQLTLDEVKALTSWTEGSSTDVTFEDAKQFIYYAKITDNAGNVSYISTDVAEYDITNPIITGITDGAIYYTTQIATATDKNLKSITLNGSVKSTPLTLDGNINTTYIIIATDKANNSTTYTVTMKAIASLSTDIDSITENNVKSSDKTLIETVKINVGNVDKANATQAEKDLLKGITDKCDSLIKKISDTAAEIARITNAVNGYDLASVKSSDKAALEQLEKDIDTLVTSGNMTDDEITALNGIKTKITNLIAKISGTAELIKQLSDTIGVYKLDEVKSTDKASIEQVIADIDTLLATENLTEDEKTALGTIKANANALLTRIADAAAASNAKDIKDAESINKDNVKLSDKDTLTKAITALEEAIKDYKGNYTETEMAALKAQLAAYNEALTVIGNSEKVETSIIALPDAKDVILSDKDDIYAAIEAYNDLSDHEKEMIDKEYVQKLDAVIAALDNLEKTPQTGDTNYMPICIALLLISGVVLTTLDFYKKRRKRSVK